MLNEARLEQLAAAADAYVKDVFGVDLDLRPVMPGNLPHFLLDRYCMWKGNLNAEAVILIAPKRLQQGATTDLIKHRDLIRGALDARHVLLLIDRAPAAIRKQLIERKVGFLAPGTQIYIPEALLDLRERTTSRQLSAPEKISPTAQTIIVASLLGRPIEGANLTQLADMFRIAIMSVSRALDELEALQIAKSQPAGRQRRLHLVLTQSHLWRAVEARLQTPVKKVRLLRGNLPIEDAPLAGISALARYTMLSGPRIERRAIGAFAWKRMASQHTLTPAMAYDDERFELETWTYDPRVLADGDAVDPISLYLSVRDNTDERVSQAAHQLLDRFAW